MTSSARAFTFSASWETRLRDLAPLSVASLPDVLRAFIAGAQGFTLDAALDAACGLWVAVADAAGDSCDVDDAFAPPLTEMALGDATAAARVLDVAHSFDVDLKVQPVRVPAGLAVQMISRTDVRRLADEWARTQKPQHVVVVGVRTGGTYLAPAFAAVLQFLGITTTVWSIRPERDLPSAHALRLNALRADADVVLVDDPPLTGATLRRLVVEIGEETAANISIAVPRFSRSGEPSHEAETAAFYGCPLTTLPRDVWQSMRQLQAPAALASALADGTFLSGYKSLSPIAFVPGWANSAIYAWPGTRHRSAPKTRFTARYADSAGAGTREFFATAAPRGLFRAPVEFVLRTLRDSVPTAVFVGDGLVITEWVDGRPLGDDEPEAVHHMRGYAVRRARTTAVSAAERNPPRDRHVLSLATAMAPDGDIARFVDALGEFLHAPAQSFPDNRMERDKWRYAGGELVKSGYLLHAYRRDVELLHPLYDVAAIGCESGSGYVAALGIWREAAQSLGLETSDASFAAVMLYYVIAKGAQYVRRLLQPVGDPRAAIDEWLTLQGLAIISSAALADALGNIIRFGGLTVEFPQIRVARVGEVGEPPLAGAFPFGEDVAKTLRQFGYLVESTWSPDRLGDRSRTCGPEDGGAANAVIWSSAVYEHRLTETCSALFSTSHGLSALPPAAADDRVNGRGIVFSAGGLTLVDHGGVRQT